MKNPFRLLPLLVLLLLAGCFQDTASYSFPEKDHGITLVRNQTWPWASTIDLEVIAIRLPDCNGGKSVKDVPENSRFALYQAPDEYPEPIKLLKVGKRVFAISTQSCRVQEFETAPPELGTRMGTFKVKDGKFQFVPADPSGKPEEE